jgi:hypothetical protein
MGFLQSVSQERFDFVVCAYFVGQVSQGMGQRVDGKAARHLPRIVTAHAVGNDKYIQFGRNKRLVFVAVSLRTA